MQRWPALLVEVEGVTHEKLEVLHLVRPPGHPAQSLSPKQVEAH